MWGEFGWEHVPALSYLRAPPPPDSCKFCTKSGGGGPLLGNVQKNVKGGPFLLFAHFGGGGGPSPPRKLCLRPTPHLGWPSAKPNPTVCNLACRWRLRSALRADRESFSIDNPRGRQLKARLYSSELSYSCIDHYLHPSRVE